MNLLLCILPARIRREVVLIAGILLAAGEYATTMLHAGAARTVIAAALPVLAALAARPQTTPASDPRPKPEALKAKIAALLEEIEQTHIVSAPVLSGAETAAGLASGPGAKHAVGSIAQAVQDLIAGPDFGCKLVAFEHIEQAQEALREALDLFQARGVTQVAIARLNENVDTGAATVQIGWNSPGFSRAQAYAAQTKEGN